MRAYRFGRIYMERFHEPSRLIGADAQHSDVGSAQTHIEDGEMRRVAGVAAEVDAAALALDHIAAPKTSMPVEQPARGRVLRRYESDFHLAADGHFIPPIKFAHILEAQRPDQPRVARGNKDSGRAGLPEQPQRREVEVVVVIGNEQDEIDLRQVAECDAGFAHPPGTSPSHRACALRPDRISQDRNSADLNEEGRVADEGDRNIVDAQPCVEVRHPLILDQARPRAARLAQHFENAPQRWRRAFGQGRVEEAPTVEVIGNRPWVRRTGTLCTVAHPHALQIPIKGAYISSILWRDGRPRWVTNISPMASSERQTTLQRRRILPSCVMYRSTVSGISF